MSHLRTFRIQRVFIFLVILKFTNSLPTLVDKPSCGAFFSEVKYTGDKVSISANDKYSHFTGDTFSNLSDNEWNTTTTSLITVEPGCEMKICNAKYFKGHCHTLGQGLHVLSNLTGFDEMSGGGNITSVSCECPSSEVHIDKHTCFVLLIK